MTNPRTSLAHNADPTWAMFVWLPCATGAMALGLATASLSLAFVIPLVVLVLLDLSPVGSAMRRREAERFAARGQGKRAIMWLAVVQLAAGIVGLVLAVSKIADPLLSASISAILLASSLSTWRTNAGLRGTAP